MSRTTSLRHQHDAAIALVGEIVAASRSIDSQTDAYRASVLLARLTGLLRIHFAQEDKTLYPYMIASANAAASERAIAFNEEMGGLSAVYEDFAKRWTCSESILNDAKAFRRESGEVFAALGARIVRENEQLYPLADAIEHYEVRRTA